jgi:hypothetical protein
MAAVKNWFTQTHCVAFICLNLFRFFSAAQAQELQPTDEETWKSAEVLRAELAHDVQFYATQLIDEMVYEWTRSKPFETPTPLLMMNISVPLGLGSGFTTLLENHLAEVLLKNPNTNLIPSHCPSCLAWTVHSTPDGTVLSRGTEDPDQLLKDSPNSKIKHSLYLDFEAQGSSLILRSKIVSLQKGLPIVSAKSYSTSTSAPALLRDPNRLKSSAEVREEYKQILAGRDRFLFPLRAIARIYSPPEGGNSSTSPFVWFEVGAESFFTQEQRWGGGISVGFTSLKGVHEGWSTGARVVRLISGSSKSFTHPDVYFVLGGTILNVKGENARAFQRTPASTVDLLRDAKGDEPQASFASWKIGTELRIKNRFSAGIFGEILPSPASNRIGTYVDLGAASIRGYGLEVGLWF